MRVDLPEPEGPQTTTTSPWFHLEVNVFENVEVFKPLIYPFEFYHSLLLQWCQTKNMLRDNRQCVKVYIKSS